jgi:hypothetical protein
MVLTWGDVDGARGLRQAVGGNRLCHVPAVAFVMVARRGFHRALTSEDAVARWARDGSGPTGLDLMNGAVTGGSRQRQGRVCPPSRSAPPLVDHPVHDHRLGRINRADRGSFFLNGDHGWRRTTHRAQRCQMTIEQRHHHDHPCRSRHPRPLVGPCPEPTAWKSALADETRGGSGRYKEAVIGRSF